MASSRVLKERAPRRSWPSSEKRRIVELTLRPGTSLRAIAREHGVHPNSVRNWKAQYHAGKLEAQLPQPPAARVRDSAPRARFVPVSIAADERPSQTSRWDASGRSVVQVAFASGATMRIESDRLDASALCALAAELRR